MKTSLEMCSKSRNRKIVEEAFAIAKCDTFEYLSWGALKVSNVGQFACNLFSTGISRNAFGVLIGSSK